MRLNLVSLAAALGLHGVDMLRLSHIPHAMRRFSKRLGSRRTTTFTQHCGARQSARYARQLSMFQIHDHVDNPATHVLMLEHIRDLEPGSLSWKPHPAHEGTTIGDHTGTTSRQVQRRQALDGFRPRKAKRPSRVGSGIRVQQAITAKARLGRNKPLSRKHG